MWVVVVGDGGGLPSELAGLYGVRLSHIPSHFLFLTHYKDRTVAGSGGEGKKRSRVGSLVSDWQ